MHPCICQQCVAPFLSKRKGAKYCSRDCLHQSEEWRQKGRESAANARASIKPEHIAKQVQARKTTSATGHKQEYLCDYCGEPFFAYASQRPRPLKFCNAQCSRNFQVRKEIPQADTEPMAYPIRQGNHS